jgi:hypothetical protein
MDIWTEDVNGNRSSLAVHVIQLITEFLSRDFGELSTELTLFINGYLFYPTYVGLPMLAGSSKFVRGS